jgi:lysozyme
MVSFLLIAFAFCAICPGAVQMLKDLEGLERTPKADPIGKLTVGHGHKCKARDPYCAKGRTFNEAQAHALLLEDIQQFESCVRKQVHPFMTKFTPAQFAAMVSFTFNLGCFAFQDSTFLRRIREMEIQM